MASHEIPDHLQIIDLSHDFRLGDSPSGFSYGLPEVFLPRIAESKRIANPGCFATAIQLAIVPLASKGLLQEDLHVTAVTGSTGAGQSLSPTTHFTWRSDNLSVYKVFPISIWEKSIKQFLTYNQAIRVRSILFPCEALSPEEY